MPCARRYPSNCVPLTTLRRRIDRLAVRGLARINRHELDVAVVVEHELAEWRQLADLAARLIEREGAVERLELARQREYGAAEFHLVEGGSNRQRLLNHERGGVTRHRVEAELDLAVGVLLVPGGLVGLHVHAEIDGIVELGRRHIGPDMLEALGADVLLEKLCLEA